MERNRIVETGEALLRLTELAKCIADNDEALRKENEELKAKHCDAMRQLGKANVDLKILADGVIIRDQKMEEYGVYTGRNETELKLAQEIYDANAPEKL